MRRRLIENKYSTIKAQSLLCVNTPEITLLALVESVELSVELNEEACRDRS